MCGGETMLDIKIEEGGSLLVFARKLSADGAASPGTSESAAHEKTYSYLPLAREWKIKRRDPNVLLLEFCRFRRAGDADFSPLYPILAVHEMLTAEDYRGELTLRFPFRAAKALTGLSLALEDPSEQSVFLNGIPAGAPTGGYYFAKSFETVPLGNCTEGENIIELKRIFKPLEKFKSSITSLFENQTGVELEAAYLLGDFAVAAKPEPTGSGLLRYNSNFTLTDEAASAYGELTSAGYPFYAGTIELSQTVRIGKAELSKESVKLYAEGLNACTAEIYVNGVRCADMNWQPYETEIGRCLREGDNEITVAVTNTLRNLLGPYHRPRGEIGALWGGYESPNKPWVGVSPQNPKWYDHRVPDTAEWTEAYLQLPFGITRMYFKS